MPQLTAQPKPITTLADAIEAGEHALRRAPEGCPALVTPHVMRMLLDAAAATEVAHG
jgi:hypothetical protein